MRENRGDQERDPFARLCHTHRRIEERLDDLQRGAAEVGDEAKRGEALDAIFNVLGFFERAGARHHDDEEESLFPRLRSAASHPGVDHAAAARACRQLAEILAALTAEHREHDAVYAELLSLAHSVPQTGPDDGYAARLQATAKRFAQLYRAHIRREEDELFPAAARALDAKTIGDLAREMSERRPDRGTHGK